MLLKAAAPDLAATTAGPAPRLADVHERATTTLITPDVLGGFVRVFDFVLIAGCGLSMALVYVAEPQLASSVPYLTAIAAVSALAVTVASRMPRNDVVRPGIVVDGFSQSVSTIASDLNASGASSM